MQSQEQEEPHEIYSRGDVRIGDLVKEASGALNMAGNCEFGSLVDTRNYKMKFDRIARILKFKPKFSIEDGAREVYAALKEGKLDPNGDKAITIKWYRLLMEKSILK